MTTSNGSGLGLDTASANQGFDLIPAGRVLEFVTKIKPGSVGIEGLLKRTSKGDAEMLDVEFVVRSGEYAGRKIFQNLLLAGTTSGHDKAAEISRALLRAIFESANNVDPNDDTPTTRALRASATLAGFHGMAFVGTSGIERGGKRPDGSAYKDRNVIDRVLRPGDQGYRRIEQAPSSPLERAAPPAQSYPARPAAGGTPAVATAPIQKPSWAE